jgi:general secretion pathway protein G
MYIMCYIGVMRKSTTGFTIVELLIVIVVIAILAALSVVAYRGIQERVNNAAVVSDLSALKKKMEIYKVDNGDVYPHGNTTGIGLTSSLGFKLTKGAYATAPTTENNFWYCRVAAQTRYAVIALSRTGDIYYITESVNPTKYTGSQTWSSTSHNCNTMIASDLGYMYAGYASSDTTTGPYRTWVGGN